MTVSISGIRLRNTAAVVEAIETYDADPNEYFNVPTAHLPWNLISPFQRQSPGKERISVPSHIRLHPLHLAVATSSHAVVRRLIDGGACVNALDIWHRNPLHVLVQPPPIDLPRETPPDETVAWPSKLTDVLTEEPTGAENYKHLSNFMFKQAGKRSANETQLASLLCGAGIDLARCDIWGRTCIDYATDWLRISRLIRSGKIGVHCLENSVPTSSLPRCIEVDCPVPVARPFDILPCSSIQLSSRIPHEVIDVVLLHEDRLRLSAIAPIVGLDVGGGISPRKLVTIPNQHIEPTKVPFATSTCTPTRPEQSTAVQLTQASAIASSFFPRSQLGSGQRPKLSGSTEYTKSQRGRPSSLLAFHILPTPTQRNLGRVTISSPSPGVTRLALRLTPQTQKADVAPKAAILTQTTLAESCLHALQKTDRRNENVQSRTKVSSSVNSGSSNDELSTFLRLASSPRFRFHSALCGIWEFLGADVFQPVSDSATTTGEHEGCSASPVQPALRHGRLSQLSVRLDDPDQ